jgi:hypothetical protein
VIPMLLVSSLPYPLLAKGFQTFQDYSQTISRVLRRITAIWVGIAGNHHQE